MLSNWDTKCSHFHSLEALLTYTHIHYAKENACIKVNTKCLKTPGPYCIKL